MERTTLPPILNLAWKLLPAAADPNAIASSRASTTAKFSSTMIRSPPRITGWAETAVDEEFGITPFVYVARRHHAWAARVGRIASEQPASPKLRVVDLGHHADRRTLARRRFLTLRNGESVMRAKWRSDQKSQ
jgi:hypothetical protein